MRVRHATPDDAGAIERVRTDTWRHAYRRLLPDAVLDRLGYDPSRRRTQMETMSADRFVLVAEQDTAVVGFCLGGPSRTPDPEYPGEVYAIYVLPAAQGRGIGRALLHAAARELIARGLGGMLIWVLSSNAPSRAFYERMGGVFVRDEERELEGIKIIESGYGWTDIAPLARTQPAARGGAA
ncbi:MAG TPA: GNAT family N-acetyltransferase [Candidatus Limnocylindria bacterium]|nr:GNAT family N-acetyltransferase [Candidatus Limnocylindria bacterium]